MILHKLHVSAFGHLQAYPIDLKPGLQLLYGPNEQGKSTLMAFIRTMFYGFAGTGRRLANNDRKKYMPWNGSPMGGSLDFEFQNQPYRLERKFGKSKAADQTVLMNGITGQILELPGNQEPGQYLFKINGYEFENTVFVRQLSSQPGTDDTLLTRLSNLAGTGDTALSHRQIDQRLKQAQNSLLAPRGDGGVLNEAKSSLEALYQHKEQAIEISREHLRKIENLSLLKAQLLNNQEQTTALQLLVERHLQHKQLSSWDQIRRLKEKLDEAQRLYSHTCQRITRNGQTAGADYTQKLRRLYSEWKEASVIVTDRTQKITRMRNDLQIFIQTHAHLQIMSPYNKEKESLRRKQLHAAQEALRLQDNFSKIHTQYLNDRHLLKTQIQSYDQSAARIRSEMDARLNLMEQERAAAKTGYLKHMDACESLKDKAKKAEETFIHHKNNPPSKKPRQPQLIREILAYPPNKALLVFFGGGVLASVTAGFFTGITHFYLLAGLLFSSFIVTIRLASVKSKRQAIFQARKIWEAQLQQLETDIHLASYQLDNYQDHLSASEKNLEDISAVYDDYRQQMSRYLQDIEKEKEKKEIELINKRSQWHTLAESLIQSLDDLADDSALSEIKHTISPENLDDIASASGKLDIYQHQIKKTIAVLQDKLQQSLVQYKCADWDEMKNKLREYEQFILVKKTKEHVISDAEKEKDQAAKAEKLIFDELASLLKPFYSLIKPEHALHYIETLDAARHKTDQLQNELRADRNRLTELLGGRTYQEWEHKTEQTRLIIEQAKSSPDYSNQEDIDSLGQRLEKLKLEQTDIRVKTATCEEEIRQIVKKQVSVSEIDQEIGHLQDKIQFLEEKYDLLEKARQALDAAADELQNSFGPELNKQTGLILNHLTAGKYDQLKIDRAFMIRLANPADNNFYEWQYLSGGTIDQVYLALRLAISDAIMAENVSLPLFLDDVFIQYDLERTNASFQFLKENSKKSQRQILFFSCQQHYVNLFKNNNCPVMYLKENKSITHFSTI